MATVPRLTPQAQTEALPGVRVGAQVSPTALGGGLVREAAEGFRDLRDVALEEERRADQLAALDFDNELARVETSLATEAQQKRGKDAFGEPERVLAEYDRISSQAMARATTPQQREQFARRSAARRIGLDASVQRHVYAERQGYDDEQTKAGLEFAANAARAHADNPERLSLEVARARGIAATHADRRGLGEFVARQRADEAESAIWGSLVADALDRGDDREAAALYAQRKDRISPADRPRLEKALEIGSTAGESQRRADAILAEATTLGEINARVAAIEDPKLRDATRARAQQGHRDRKLAEQEEQEQDYENAHQLVARVGSADGIPTTLRARILARPGGQKDMDALEKYAAALNRRDAPPKNSEAWYVLRSLASTDAGREEFLQTNLLRYAGDIDETQLAQLVELQADMRGKKPAGATTRAEWAGVNSVEETVNQTLAMAKIDPRPLVDGKANEPAIRFRRQLDRLLQAHQDSTGKKPSPEDARRYAERLLVEETVSTGERSRLNPARWFGDRESSETRRAFELPNADRLAYDLKQVPAEHLPQIRAALAQEGRAPTDEAVLRRYNAWVAMQAKP